MLSKLIVRKFKRFDEVSVELGERVVFVGPNDSGKTTALQALTLWEIGLKRWNEKRKGSPAPEKRSGVAINRKDLIAIPVPQARSLWHNLAVRNVERTDGGKQATQNIVIDILVEGVTNGKQWECGFEFDYANEESFYCRPLRSDNGQRFPVPDEAAQIRLAYLPPMSGLAANETRLDPGAISVRLGEGRTAEVLRNLCYQIVSNHDGVEGARRWEALCRRMKDLFGINLKEPEYNPERGEITMTYVDRWDNHLDLSSSGRGMQQTLLLLAHLAANPGSVLLLDEPDAHLEILRQRQIYQVLTDTATEQHCQVIAASHSEVVLNEAAGRDVVVAFVGKPHRIDDRGSQLLKSLREIQFEDYYLAEQTGWILYLEGSTDLAVLLAFARKLNHPAAGYLQRPAVHYVFNQPRKAREHFFGLREAKRDLVGLAIFDRLDSDPESEPNLTMLMWRRREIENYLCQKETLLDWAKHHGEDNLGELLGPVAREAMETCIKEIEDALFTLGKSPWDADTKVSDDFLRPLFQRYFKEMSLPNVMEKSSYHELAEFVTPEQIDSQVADVLDVICRVAQAARPIA